MQYLDYIQPKDEQQRTRQPNHPPNLEWQNPPDMLTTVTTFNGFIVRLVIAEKEIHINRTMAISMFKYTYRLKSPSTTSKVELPAVPRRD